MAIKGLTDLGRCLALARLMYVNKVFQDLLDCLKILGDAICGSCKFENHAPLDVQSCAVGTAELIHRQGIPLSIAFFMKAFTLVTYTSWYSTLSLHLSSPSAFNLQILQAFTKACAAKQPCIIKTSV